MINLKPAFIQPMPTGNKIMVQQNANPIAMIAIPMGICTTDQKTAANNAPVNLKPIPNKNNTEHNTTKSNTNNIIIIISPTLS